MTASGAGGRLVDVADDADRVGRHQGVDVRLDQRTGIQLGRLEFFGEADFVGNVFRDRQVADRRTKRVAARRDHHAGRKIGAVPAPPLQGAFPFARDQRRSENLAWHAGGNVGRRMQLRRIHLADHFVRLLAVKSPRALVPPQDGAIHVLADDRVFGRGLQQADEKVGRAFAIADNLSVK